MSDNMASHTASHVSNATETAAAPPRAALLQMMTGYLMSQSLYVAAKLGIPDLLADGPVGIEALAAETKTHAPSLHRVMRALTSIGVFSEPSAECYALTPLSALLQSATPGSMRALAIMYAEEQYRAWGDVLYSVRTGEPAFDHVFGKSPFAYYAEHPETAHTFNEAMIGYSSEVANAMVASYDCSSFQTIVDVGGGYGTLLATILQSNPSARGILFDQPPVVAGADEFLRTAGVAERCTCVGGDFFTEIPAGNDAYLLSQILHDWDDDHCRQILQQIRRAIPPQGKLLTIELVIPESNEPFFGNWLDLHMLVVVRGRERTAAEYGALFHATGFDLARIVPTPAGPSVVEAVPV